jgi:hypothetical protein
VTPAAAAALPEGSWVEVTGALNADTLREVQGVFVSTGVFLVQFEGEGPSPVVATNAKRMPAFTGLESKEGWVLGVAKRARDAGMDDDAPHAPSPAAVALFTTPQTLRGVLYTPGGQPGAKSDTIELDDESFEVARYCRDDGVRYTGTKLVLVTGEEPRSRANGVVQALVGLVVGLGMALFAIFGGRRGPQRST